MGPYGLQICWKKRKSTGCTSSFSGAQSNARSHVLTHPAISLPKT